MTVKPIHNAIAPYVLDSPVGVDIIVKDIQQSLNSLAWLDASFNRAETMTKITDGSVEIFPKLWVEDGIDEVNAIGLDQFSAYSFFHANSPKELLGEYNFEGNQYTQDVNLYLWVDLVSIDPLKGYDFLSELIQDVEQLLNKSWTSYGQFQIKSVIDNPLDVYDDFSVVASGEENLSNQAFTQSVNYPYRAVRFELETVFYDIKC